MSSNYGPAGTAAGLQGSGYKQIQQQTFTPEQMKLFGELFGQVGADSQLAKLAGGDQATFDQIEAPALKQFGQLQGDIASRFSQGGGGAGAMSGRRSSGFNIAQNTAASDFAQQLQANRQNLMRQARQDLMGTSQMLLGQRPYENQLVPEQEKSNWFLDLVKALGGAGGKAVGNLGTLSLAKKLGLTG